MLVGEGPSPQSFPQEPSMFASRFRKRTRGRPAAPRPNPNSRPQVEALEDRLLLAANLMPAATSPTEVAVVGTAGDDTLVVTAADVDSVDSGAYQMTTNGVPGPVV